MASIFSLFVAILVIFRSSAFNFTSPLCPGSCSLSEIMLSIKHDAQVITNNSEMVQMLEQLIAEKMDTSNNPQCDLIRSYYRRFQAQNTFATAFKDLCNVVFTYDDISENETETDTILRKKIINEHMLEDGSHWKLFYSDFESLGLNTKIDNNDLLLYWFGDFTLTHRKTIYNIMRLDAKYGGDMDPIVRYVIVIAVEETGQAMFDAMNILYQIYKERCFEQEEVREYELKYVAQEHLIVETGDLILRTERYKELKAVLFDDYIIQNEHRKNMLLEVGRSVIWNINNSLHQNYVFLTDSYKKQKLWDLE